MVLIAIALAMVLRFVMDPLLGNTEPFPTLYGAVALAAWHGGYKLGLLATALGYLAANFLIIEPRWAFGLPRPADLLALPLYLVSCCIITGFASAMRTARNRYKTAAHDALRRQEDLEHEIAERTQSEERLRLALDAGRMATWEWDIQTDEVTQSAHGETLRDSSPEVHGATGRAASLLNHPDDLKAVLKTAAQSGGRRTEYESEFRQPWPDGSIHWVLQKGKIVSDEHGLPVRMIGVSIDIIERKQAEEAIKDADRRKEEFLAILSHELRSPLNVVLLWVRLLRSGVVDASTTRRALEIIEENARLQNRLIADLLDVSRIIAGKLTLDMRTVDLARLTVIAVDSQRPLAVAKRISVNMRVKDGVGIIVGDPARLEQVIGNVLSNALKFTPEGGHIDIALLRTDHTAQIIVSDSGKGIRPDLLPFVFDRFRQDEGARAHGGLGLGLYTVRRLVELHGGRVSARSEGDGRGATFVIELPVAQTGGGSAPATPVAAPRPLPFGSVSLSGVRVLSRLSALHRCAHRRLSPVVSGMRRTILIVTLISGGVAAPWLLSSPVPGYTRVELTDPDTERTLATFVLRDDEQVVLTWRNSMWGLDVTEVFIGKSGVLRQTEVTFAQPNGPPPPRVAPHDVDSLYHTGGAFSAKGLSRPLGRVVYRVGEVGNPTMRFRDRTVAFMPLVGFGGRVVLSTATPRLYGVIIASL